MRSGRGGIIEKNNQLEGRKYMQKIEKMSGAEEPLSIIKVKNGYMVTKGKTMYETPYKELCVFNTFAAVVNHLAANFNESGRPRVEKRSR